MANKIIEGILNRVKERFYSDSILRENDHLKAENFTLRRKLAEMHRRAQKNESALERYEQYKKKHEEDVIKRALRIQSMYEYRYREAVQQIVDGGVDNVVERRPDGTPFITEGSLTEMIRRCLADREKALEENRVLKEKILSLTEEPKFDYRPSWMNIDKFVGNYDCEDCRIKDGASRSNMIVCPDCFDKRCPKAKNHKNECCDKDVND